MEPTVIKGLKETQGKRDNCAIQRLMRTNDNHEGQALTRSTGTTFSLIKTR